MSFLSGVKSLNGSFWPCERPAMARIISLLVDGLTMLAKRFFSVDFAEYQPVRVSTAL